MRILVVDDEKPVREKLVALLRAEPDVEAVTEVGCVRDAVESIRERDFDLVFLDVHLHANDGFDVINEVGPGLMPPVVFATAYDSYAVQAFEVNSIDYLLKPFEKARLRASLDRAKERIDQDRHGAALDRLMASLRGELSGDGPRKEPWVEWIATKSTRGIRLLDVREIRWIEANGKYVTLHTDGETVLHRESLGSLTARLPPSRFVRIHRSTTVNLAYIDRLEPWFAGDYLVYLKDGTKVRLSRTYRERFEERLHGLP